MRCPSNAQIRNRAKEWMTDKAEEYEEARAEAFREFFTDESYGMTYDELDDEWFDGLRDSFTFPDEEDWLANEYESFIGDIADQCYEEYKDERIERE